MGAARARTFADWSASAWGSERCRVLVVGEPRFELAPAEHTQLDAPTSLSQLHEALLAGPPDGHDSALICGWGRELELPGAVDLLRRSVRPGGIVAFVAPVAQIGWRGARGAVLGLLRRQRPVPLEELCSALLLGHLVDIRARPLEGASGYSAVWATVPPPWREDIESSAVLLSREI